ncbi:MAG: hypothetical protein DRP09_18595 [Candidatus Thorarchaeota archaeon]|nr:MAG: hypothetical protein DRP09_18595 [Candidatus Thorarchaeota archaeon]
MIDVLVLIVMGVALFFSAVALHERNSILEILAATCWFAMWGTHMISEEVSLLCYGVGMVFLVLAARDISRYV